MNILKNMIKEMFHDDLNIQHKLLNLILSVAFIGGMISLTVSMLIGINVQGNLTIAFLVFIVGLDLWIANVKKKPGIAAILIVLAANMLLFPVMYFTAGGMVSGMPVWLVLGMIFSWLILTGKTCIIMYVINALVVAGCILLEMKYPQLVNSLVGREIAYWDMLQSIIVVTCIFGCIFKYQTYVYEKQKKQILKANQVKAEFLANMSHEVRTPINAILGYNEMIMKESRESQVSSYALNVQAAGRMLLSQMNDIFDFTNIERDDFTVKKEKYHIKEILQDIIAYAEYNTEKKGLSLKLSVDENIPSVLSGDEIRITQILYNLISNAVKYTREGYVGVTIGWNAKDEKTGVLAVKISDSGIGMKKTDVEKISESFVRFDKEQTRNVQGMGLGLTIVTRLLKLMNSRLMVESEFGKGSVFSFEIEQNIIDASPMGDVEKHILDEQSEIVLEAPSAKILLVDDNRMNLDLLVGMLKNTRMKIDTCANGMEAVEQVKKEKYHIIFLDHMMPVMDGVEALKKMKEEKLCGDTPIIVLTANAVGNAKEEYLAAGFDDYLSKPILYKQLLELVIKYLPDELKVEEDDFYFLDTKLGMEYCCNNEDFYKEMLGTYLENSKTEDIEKSYSEEDWDNYRIQVHALKSTSLSIGASGLSENAKKLEMAAKEGRIDYIRENHYQFMTEYNELLSLLKKALNKADDAEEKNTETFNDEREHILVVDDDHMNLMVAEKLLGEKFKVSAVKSGEEALGFLENEIPDLILLDLHMPEMGGFEVIRIMRQKEKLADIPVVFLTADNDRESEINCFREGALDFIAKPFVADIMLQRIKRILDLNRLQKNLQNEVTKQTRRAEERREKVERLTLQMMLTLANTIDAKDKYTNGHSVRVAEYAREIARRTGKTEQEQEAIYFTGLLHDIGKIGIPNSIINKSTGLTEEEYEIVKTHPRIGADILESMTEIPGLADGAHWHHELYDGNGYPDRLKGNEIPEMARIIGVADAYDAMASKRSYRDTLPQNIVREEIRNGIGMQFDPVFARIMLEMIDEDTEYLMCER